MTSTALAKQPATISTNAARLAMGATVAYQLLLIALIFVRPTWRPPGTQSTNGPLGAKRLDHAFLISALSYGALFAMLSNPAIINEIIHLTKFQVVVYDWATEAAPFCFASS